MPSARPAVRSESRIPFAPPLDAHGARGGSVGLHLEVGGDRREVLRIERPAGRCEEAQDATAFERADGEPAHHELVERAGQRRRRQLPAGGQQLLGHEGAAAGALRDQEQEARRRPLAFDALDERGEFVAVEERQREPLHRSGGRGDRRERAGPRVVARDDVRLVRDDERQPLVRGDPGEKGHQRPGGGIRPMQVLEDEHDRLPLAEPAQHAEDAFERARLASFGRALVPDRRQPAGAVEPSRDPRHDAGEVRRGGTEDGVELVVRERVEGRPDGPHDRTVRLVRAGRHRPAAQDAHRLGEPADAPDRLVEEPADPDAGRPADQHRPRPAAGRIVEDRGQPREGALAPHIPRARVPAGHGGHSRPRSEADDPGFRSLRTHGATRSWEVRERPCPTRRR